MGIRYYAYAYEADEQDLAFADPLAMISEDPLADAWGFEPGATGFIQASFQQSVPERDMLYLDKAWSHLQYLTGGRTGVPARVAFRMFEGRVVWADDGYSPFVRALSPDEAARIARDLADLSDADAEEVLSGYAWAGREAGSDVDYALDYLRRARTFTAGLVETGRGMVYTIG